MGLFDELSKAASPHVSTLNETLNLHGFLLHDRLREIEDRISTLGRPDIGDHYFRRSIVGKLPIGETELFEVPMNQYMPLQYMTVNGLTLKSPAFTITADRVMVLAVAKEGVGQETPGGDIVFLPSETVSINMAEAGNVEITLGFIRVPIVKQSVPVQYGRSEELLAGSNTHDPKRDVITTSDKPWEETPPETVDSGGRPVITR